MEMLKKFWPTPFRIKPKDVTSLVVQLVIFVVVCAVVGALLVLAICLRLRRKYREIVDSVMHARRR